ncbi:hypothetical protein [Neptunicella sp. SCSIO 80796]|uniref:hypothetical protein n=1 Tax=Neptunicella plasticusilytica TaxID=3117012 RepID=UPI003A4D2072
MIAAKSFNYIQEFQFLGRPDINLPPFRDYLMSKAGEPVGLGDIEFTRIHDEYMKKLEECSPRVFASIKHVTLISGPVSCVFEAIVANLQLLRGSWTLSVFVRNLNGAKTELLNKWDIEISWDDLLMHRLDLAPYIHKQFKMFTLGEDQELCLEISGGVLPIGSAMVAGIDISYFDASDNPMLELKRNNSSALNDTLTS